MFMPYMCRVIYLKVCYRTVDSSPYLKMDTSALTIVQLTSLRAEALDRVIEFGLKRDDARAWKDNMDESVSWITCDLMARRIILHAKLTLPEVVRGIHSFPLNEIHTQLMAILDRKDKLHPAAEVLRIQKSVTTTIELVSALFVYTSTAHTDWPESFIEMIHELCKFRTVPNLAEARRFYSANALTADDDLCVLIRALQRHASWLNEVIPTIFEYRDAFVTARLCQTTAKMQLDWYSHHRRQLEREEGKQQSMAELAAKELELRANCVAPAPHEFTERRFHPRRLVRWRP